MYPPRCSYGVRLPYILTLSVPQLSSRTFEPRVHCANLNMKSGCADVSPRIFIRKEFYQMKTETVILDPARPDVTLTSYILPGCRPAMIVLPGGGFCELASYEGDPIAVHFMAKGFNAFVLRYTIGQPQSFFPRPLTDVSAAIVHGPQKRGEILHRPRRHLRRGNLGGAATLPVRSVPCGTAISQKAPPIWSTARTVRTVLSSHTASYRRGRTYAASASTILLRRNTASKRYPLNGMLTKKAPPRSSGTHSPTNASIRETRSSSPRHM